MCRPRRANDPWIVWRAQLCASNPGEKIAPEYYSEGDWNSGIKVAAAQSLATRERMRNLLVADDVLEDLKARPYCQGPRTWDNLDPQKVAEWSCHWWVVGGRPEFRGKAMNSKAILDPLKVGIPQIPGRWVFTEAMFVGKVNAHSETE